jgi:hypothetical protein
MTPQEKSEELIEKYQKLDIEIGGQYDGYLTMKMHDAKQCALIAVDEILVAIDWHEFEYPNEHFEYWHEVKDEINKL